MWQSFRPDHIEDIYRQKCILNGTLCPQRVENIVGKEVNTGYQHFLLFQKCFLNCQGLQIL